MSSIEDVTAVATAYGREQYLAGMAYNQPTIAALNAQVADLQHELAKLQTPIGYTEVAAKDLQSAIDNQVRAYVRGEFDFSKKILIPPPGADIWLADEACLWRNFEGGTPTATQNSIISNRDWTKPTGPVSIRGTGRIQSRSGVEGSIIGLWCSQLELLDFKCDEYFNGKFWDLGVDGNMHVARLQFQCDENQSSGTAGARTSHCGSGIVEDCNDCSAGDDLWQAVPAGNSGDPLFNKGDVKNLIYRRNHRGRSHDGRMVVVGLQDKPDDGTTRYGMRSGVHGVLFQDLDGWGGKSAAVIQNKSSIGSITDITYDGVYIDQSDATAGQPAEVFFNGVPTTGGIDRVTIKSLMIAPRKTGTKTLFEPRDKVTNVVGRPVWGTRV